MAERKRINTQVRNATFEWLDRNGYSYIPSVSNCFMLDTKRPAKQANAAMAEQKIIVGRIRRVMPTYTRITVGTHEEMEKFQVAFQNVIAARWSRAPGKTKNRSRGTSTGLCCRDEAKNEA